MCSTIGEEVHEVSREGWGRLGKQGSSQRLFPGPDARGRLRAVAAMKGGHIEMLPLDLTHSQLRNQF